ncbi:hypothetical protein ABK040_015453 [Willaertia magna]
MGKTKSRQNEPSISYSQYCNYTHKINPQAVSEAMKLRAQNETWSCGPHSAARAKTIMKTFNSNNFNDFINKCPKSFGNSNVSGTVSGAAVGTLFGPIGTLIGAGIGFAFDEVSKKYPVGPTPSDLANYANGSYYSSKSFDDKFIETTVDQGNAIVVLFMFSPLSMHYVNVIGYDEYNYVILDTNNSIRLFSKSYMSDLMDCSSHILCPTEFKPFNYIVFN